MDSVLLHIIAMNLHERERMSRTLFLLLLATWTIVIITGSVGALSGDPGNLSFSIFLVLAIIGIAGIAATCWMRIRKPKKPESST